jgi:hypothetical protein
LNLSPAVDIVLAEADLTVVADLRIRDESKIRVVVPGKIRTRSIFLDKECRLDIPLLKSRSDFARTTGYLADLHECLDDDSETQGWGALVRRNYTKNLGHMVSFP